MPLIFRTTERRSGDIVVLDVFGRIVLGDGSKQLSEEITRLLGSGNKKIILNLAEVSYVDSSGLGEMVSSYSQATRQVAAIKLLNIQPRIAELLKVTKLDSLFEAFSAESDALASFEQNQEAASA